MLRELIENKIQYSDNPAKYRLMLWILDQRWISPQFFLAVIGRR